MHNLTKDQLSTIKKVLKLTESFSPDYAAIDVYKLIEIYKGYFWIDLRNYLVANETPHEEAFYAYSRAVILYDTAERACNVQR